MVRQGKARYIGVSNWPAYRIARALGWRGQEPCPHDSVQPRYNLLFRAFERDLSLAARERHCGDPYNPIAGGLLSGKHDGTAPPPRARGFRCAQRAPDTRRALA